MPLNQPNLSKYRPNPVGPVKLQTRSSTRARLYGGGTYFRSNERGEVQNLIQIGILEDGVIPNLEGVCIVQNTVLKPDEQVTGTGVTPVLELYKLELTALEEITIAWNGTQWRATKTGIRWQIAPGPVPAPVDLGAVQEGLFVSSVAVFKITGLGAWPHGAVVVLRPRTRRYTLVVHGVTDPNSPSGTTQLTGWDPNALRQAVNADTTVWIRMPVRNTVTTPDTGPALPPSGGEDKQDSGVDADFLTAFAMANLSGGNGLPMAPVGLNTGPDRVMVHLNYSEKDDGSMGELNQVFEWVGDSATIGSWQRYS
jgi:hypothetical protein